MPLPESDPDDPSAAARRTRGRPRGWEDKTAQNTIKSLDRAMEVFDYLSTHQGLTLSALAAGTGQSAATLYRVLVTLEGRGLVEFDAVDQTWHIGARAFTIGARFLRRTSLVERARPVLRQLMQATGETANLGIVQNHSVLFLSQVETHSSIRAFFPPGTLSPLHASGIGKALLAEMAPPQRDAVLAGPLERFTPKTLTDPRSVIDDLARIRARGYSLDDEEKTLGMRCVAAPVFDVHGEAVGGLSVSGPVARMAPERIEGFAGPVIAAAAELTAAIGGTVPAR